MVIGVLFDFVASGERFLKGETILGNGSGMFGGKGANRAVQASRLGAEVYDWQDWKRLYGDKICITCKGMGIYEFVRKDKESSTAACCIHVDKMAIMQLSFRRRQHDLHE